MNSKIDISEDTAQNPNADTSSIVRLANCMIAMQDEIEHLEKLLALTKTDLLKMQTETMPELMESLGVSSQTLTNGYQIITRPLFQSNIPALSTIEKADEYDRDILLQRREDGIDWLTHNNGDSLIKTEIKIKLGKGQTALLKAVLKALKILRFTDPVTNKNVPARVPIEQSETIHPASLNKFLQETLANGANVPLETFAVYQGKKAEIKIPKAK